MTQSPQPAEHSQELQKNEYEEVQSLDLRVFARVLRRHFWLILLCTLLGVVGGFWYNRNLPDIYSAQVLLQRQAPNSPLDALTGALGNVSAQDIASQVEVLRSESVLAQVADSMSLRMTMDKRGIARSKVFSAVQLAPDAPWGSYRLEQSGKAYRLVDDRKDEVLATALAGGQLKARGLTLTLAAPVTVDLPLHFRVAYPDATVRRLRNALDIQNVRGTTIVRIRYSDPDPQMAAGVVNSVASAYQLHIAERSRGMAARRRRFIAAQLAQVTDSLQAAQGLLANYQQRSQSLDPKAQGESLSAEYIRAENDVRALRFQESVLVNLMTALNSRGTADDAYRRLAAIGNDILPASTTLYNQLQELVAQRQRQTSSPYGMTRDAPNVTVTDSLIASTKNEIRRMVKEGVDLTQARRAASEKHVAELASKLSVLPSQASALGRLQQQVDAAQKTFDLLADKYYEAQIAEAVESGDVDVIDTAAVPMVPNQPPTRRNLIIALLIGLAVGAFAGYLREKLDRSVRSAQDVELATGLPILGAIPELQDRGSDMPLLLHEGVQGRAAESFRALRTTLRFMRSGQPHVIAVTSGEPGEGKTLISVNLALSFAHQGARVLLIDGDLRRPRVHLALGIARIPGFSDVLVGDRTLADVSVPIEKTTLSVMAAGSPSLSPAELLGGDSLRAMLEEARATYDVVVIDTPPVAAVADAAIVASQTDAMLLVARAGQTNRFVLTRAVHQLRQVGAPLFGTVVNGISASRSYGSTYGSYGYYDYTAYGHYGDNVGEKNGTRPHALAGRVAEGVSRILNAGKSRKS